MIVKETYGGVKIYYSSFFEKFIVLWPTKNGKFSMNRFENISEARDFIDENLPSQWYQKD